MTPDLQSIGLAAARAWRVPRALPGQTVAILASGPSLTAEQADKVKRFWTIAISDSWRLAPWADVLYSCDARWWDYHQPAARGLQVGLEPAPAWPRTRTLRADMESTLSDDPEALATGSQGKPSRANSGYQAINLAALMGAHRILLLGYDMRSVGGRTHFFGEHPAEIAGGDNFRTYTQAFEPLAKALDARGIRVINCTPDSALTCFQKVPLESVFG